MSFFIRRNQINGQTKNVTGKQKKRKAKGSAKEPPKKDDEVITSSEDEEDLIGNKRPHLESSEDENETAQEKKLRLAKIYLKEIEEEERRRLEDKEVSKEIISQRLKEDHLKQIGKYESKVASQYVGVDESDIKKLKCREQRNSITCVCLSSDDKWIFSGSKDGVVVKWSIDGDKLDVIPFVKKNANKITGHTGQILSIALSTDRKYLVVSDTSNLIYIWDPHLLGFIGTLKGHRRPVTGLAFKQNSHTLYSCSQDRSVRVWSVDEMAFVETLFGHQDEITAIDVMHAEKPVSAGGLDGTVRLWKVAEESQLIYNAAPEHVDCVRLINEQYFVTGGDNGQVCIWSSMKKKPIHTIKQAHGCDPSNSLPYWISAVASLPHTDLIASGSQDGFIRLWKLEDKYRTATRLFEIPVTGFVNSLAFTSNGKYLIAALGKDYRLGRWSVIKSATNCVLVMPLNKSE